MAAPQYPTRINVHSRGSKLPLDVQPSDTGADVRRKIEMSAGSTEGYDLVFRGHVHLASEKPLSQYKLPQGADIHMFRSRGTPAAASVQQAVTATSAPTDGLTRELLAGASTPSKRLIKLSSFVLLFATCVILCLVARDAADSERSSNALYNVNVHALCKSLGNQTLDMSRSVQEYAREYPCHGGADHDNTCGIPGMWALDEAPWTLTLWIIAVILGTALPLGMATKGRDARIGIDKMKEHLVCCCCIPSSPSLLSYVLSGWFLGSYVVSGCIMRAHANPLTLIQSTCSDNLGSFLKLCQLWVTWSPAWLWVLWPMTVLVVSVVLIVDYIWPITTTRRVAGTNRYVTETERPMAVPLCVIGSLAVACIIVAILSIPLSLMWLFAGLLLLGGPLAAGLCWVHLATHISLHMALKTFSCVT